MITRITLALGALAIAGASAAQQSYAMRKTDIRAAYFHLNGDHLPVGPGYSATAPHVWFNVDSNVALKPAGWNVFNPLAAGVLTAQSATFFSSIYADTPGPGVEQTKRMAGYWWLDVAGLNDEEMGQLDVGLLQVTTPNLQVSPGDRERLRRFVDKGGVLWVDLAFGSFDQANGSVFPFRLTYPGTPNANPQWDLQSPLLRYPNTLTNNEIQTLAIGPTYGTEAIFRGNINPVDLSVEGAASVAPLLNSIVGVTGSFSHLKPVTAAAGSPTAMYGRVGDGYVVVTSRGTSEMANRTSASTNRRFFAADPNGQLGRSGAASVEASAAIKFAVNVISLAAESAQNGSGSRRNFGSFIDVGAPLLQTWNAAYGTGSIYTATERNGRAPVIYKGLTVAVADNRVVVLDGDPRSDADGDGNQDDGSTDLSLGEDRDLIWASNIFPGRISSAVCVEVPSAATLALRDLVLVTTENGQLAVFSLFDNNRRLRSGLALAPDALLTPGAGGAASLVAGEWPVAPTVHEGIAYVADTVNASGQDVGRMWQVDLRTLSVVQSPISGNNFVFGGTAAAIQRISGSPTVGYIPIMDNSGGLDKVVYAPLKEQPSPQANAGVMSIWAGVKGERPTSVAESGGVVAITTRAATQGGLPIYLSASAGDPLGFRISILRNDGTLLTAAQMASLFTGAVTQSNGTVSLTLSPMAVWPPVGVDPDNGVRVDYTIDWGAAFPSLTAGIERGRLNFPSPTGLQRTVIGGIALSPTGTIYATVSTQNANPAAFNVNDYNGSLFAIREEGRGQFRCPWKWDLYPQHSFANNGTSTTVQAVLADNDPVQNLTVPVGAGSINLNFVLGGGYRLATFQGAPVIRNGEVYVAVSGAKRNLGGFSVPAGALLCFSDDASTREIRVGRRLGQNAIIVQPDMARSSDPTNPTTFSALPPDRVRVEKEEGQVGGIIRLDNLFTAQRGQITDSISVSQPVIIRQDGLQDIVIDPSQQGDRWNPLKWYTILHGTQLSSTALGTGNTVFVSGKSFLPPILNGVFPGDPNFREEAIVMALNTNIDPGQAKRPNDAGAFTTNPANFQPLEIVADQARPYLRQVISMDYVRAANSFTATELSINRIRPSQAYVWPQSPRNSTDAGQLSFEDFVVRVNQCVLKTSGTTGLGFTPSSFGVVAGDGLLAAWNNERVYGFRRANTWVADEGRIALLDPSGNPLFDSSKAVISGSTGGSTAAVNLRQLGRPTRIYPIPGSSDVLVVDSDKGRVFRMNPSGVVGRVVSEMTIDSAFVPTGYKSNESLEFSNPRDAWTWVSQETPVGSGGINRFSGAQAQEYWVHYLVADQGNGRLIELVDRYAQDAATGRITSRLSEGTLLWHSPSEVSGAGWGYNSFTRLQVGNRFVVIAGLGGKAPTRRDSGEGGSGVGDLAPTNSRTDQTGNGGIVIFDPTIAGGYRVFSTFNTPAVNHTMRWDFTTGTWSTNAAADILARERPMVNLQSVTASLIQGIGAPLYTIMIADATGVYEVLADSANPVALNTRWMLPSWAYQSMRRPAAAAGVVSANNPLKFFPTYARRIDDDNVMVVNGYNGVTLGNSAFDGEVVQVDGAFGTGVLADIDKPGFSLFAHNLGFNFKSIKLLFGPVEGTRGLSLPVFADRR